MRRLFFIDLGGIFCYTWIVRRIRKRRMVMKLKKAALKAVGKIVNKVTSSTVQGTSAGVKSGYTADSELIALCRRIGAESVVMLKNNGNVLPLDRSRKVSVFGR